jgi:phosphonate transport system permease protein
VRFVGPAALFVIATSRSINSLIWDLLLVTVIGPGILATVLVSEWVTAKVRHAVI